MKTKLLFTVLLSIFLTSIAKAQLDDRFYQPSKEMKPMISNYQEISIPVDEDVITAYHFKSKLKNPKANILFFHGAAGNVSTYTFMTDPLVENGFDVVAVDFRGYGKSTGKPTHTNVEQDAQLFFDYLLKNDSFKNTKWIIYGASLGSQVAARIAKDNMSKISGLVIDGGMSSFIDIASLFAPQYKDMISLMLANVYQAKEDVKSLKGLPKLFIYSKNDKTIPFEQGEEVFKNAAEPKQLLEYTKDHLEAMKEKPNEIFQAIDKMVK